MAATVCWVGCVMQVYCFVACRLQLQQEQIYYNCIKICTSLSGGNLTHALSFSLSVGSQLPCDSFKNETVLTHKIVPKSHA